MNERRKLPTTKEMVQNILLETDSRKGISLRRIYKYIEEKYTIEITARRKGLTKKYLTDLISENMLKNVTGKGLTGSLILAKKEKFLQNLKPQNVSVKWNNGKKPTKGKGAHRPDNEQNQQEESFDNEEVQQQQQQSQFTTTVNTDKRNTRNAKTKGSQKIMDSKRRREEDNRDDDEEEEEEEEGEGDEDVEQQQQQQQQSQLSTMVNTDKRNTRNAKTKGSQKIMGSKRRREQDNRDNDEEEEEDEEVEQQQQQQVISMFDTPLEYDRPTTSTPYSLRNKVAPTAPVRKNRTKKKTPPTSYNETPRASGRLKKFKPMEQIDETIY